jgi:hypothetical protein
MEAWTPHLAALAHTPPRLRLPPSSPCSSPRGSQSTTMASIGHVKHVVHVHPAAPHGVNERQYVGGSATAANCSSSVRIRKPVRPRRGARRGRGQSRKCRCWSACRGRSRREDEPRHSHAPRRSTAWRRTRRWGTASAATVAGVRSNAKSRGPR